MADIPPKTDTPMHYTNTIDYLVCTHGTIEILLHDGSKYMIKPGDFAVQLANVHQLNNVGDDWARGCFRALDGWSEALMRRKKVSSGSSCHRSRAWLMGRSTLTVH